MKVYPVCCHSISQNGSSSGTWMDEGGGKTIYMACTWTAMASGVGGQDTDRACGFDMYGGRGCAVTVPRYEYNNMVFSTSLSWMLTACLPSGDAHKYVGGCLTIGRWW